MTTAQPALTIDNIKAFDRDPRTKKARQALRFTREVAERTTAHVKSYTLPIFLAFDFKADKADGRLLTDDKDLYLSEDEVGCVAYYAACDAAHKANGYEMQPGYCPALVAGHAVIRAEVELLKLAHELLGVPFHECYGEAREEALRLIMTMPLA